MTTALPISVSLALGVPTSELGNCFSGNDFTTSAPVGLEELAPCGQDGSGGDWDAGALNVLSWLDDISTHGRRRSISADAVLPPKPVLDNMPDAATAPARPDGQLVSAVDADALTVPPAPAG